VENPFWRQSLPRDGNGAVVLDREAAVQMAFVNSPDYQRQLENLYLSALTVTFERFRFDTQFFGSTSTAFTADGPLRGAGRSQSTLQVENDAQAKRLLATGAELVVGLANSLVWQFSGPDSYQANTLLNFSLVQPLLRAGGRAVVLERLTEAERAMLANARQMEQFRRGFYAQVVAGRNPGPGPAEGGPGIPSVSFPTGVAGGYLGLLAEQVRIRNQRFTVAGLRSSLAQIEAFYKSQRIDLLQVAQNRQALYEAESQLLAAETTGYQDRLDNYKILLGLPPDLEVRISDPLLARFDLILPEMTATQDAVSGALTLLRDEARPLKTGDLATLEKLLQRVRDQMQAVEQELGKLDQVLPARRQVLAGLAGRPEIAAGTVEPAVYDVKTLDDRVVAARGAYGKLAAEILTNAGEFEQLRKQAAEASQDGQVPEELRKKVKESFLAVAAQLTSLALIQARARLEAVYLIPVDLTPEDALKIARSNRPDWMNARSALVDSWRQIEIAANALKSDLNLTFSGDVNTVGNNPVRFKGSTGRLRVGVEFDAPLTRQLERNLYRRAQIEYDQARRQYYGFEDRIGQVLRSELRDIRLRQLDFELRRQAVLVAIAQVEMTQYRISRPPAPGEKGGSSQLGATTVRDLVDSLDRLLRAQNAFLNGWVDYETQRLNLDFDLGTMQLDDHCTWVDPGPIDERSAPRLEDSDPAPADAMPAEPAT
jgi:outer membrane protein TolC